MKSNVLPALVAPIVAATWLAQPGLIQARNTNYPAATTRSGAGGQNDVAAEEDKQGLVRMNFRNASLDSVLDHLSAAGHLIIHKETDAHGAIDVESKDPLTTDQAIDLLNSALKKNGWSAIRDGRILTTLRLTSANRGRSQLCAEIRPNSYPNHPGPLCDREPIGQ